MTQEVLCCWAPSSAALSCIWLFPRTLGLAFLPLKPLQAVGENLVLLRFGFALFGVLQCSWNPHSFHLRVLLP